ncbi:hypothetical protein RhiirA1_479578 [Rhizophagus irregularis]|uniref:Uncharacterized protein n=1 Tax=Rhizophagus irregularis TaxID=588596 RepID=A0A2I1F1M4_9GLOM|nr:hypothetical protein RhiirA1_479578 [Rhizophagus irregularis]PKY28261.1 hypothetical protein RhiirB3_444346 [Rhizophagus irregularis]
MINNSIFLQFEEKDDKIDNKTKPLTLKISNHKIQVLIIKSFFDLKNIDLNNSINDNSKNKMKSDYNIKELT